jgi:UrcA family protein
MEEWRISVMKGKLHRLMLAAPTGVVLGLGAMMVAGAGTALAASAPDTVVVQYGDLNTGTPAGVQELADRVQKAAWDYCLNTLSLSEEPSLIDNLQCREAVIGETLAKINNPLLNQKFPGVRAEDDWHGD